MIDLCTHQSAAASIPNKNKETIIKHIFQLWIDVYSTRQKFLTDNGAEFANSEFLEMANHLGITVHTTDVESPWSNEVVRRNNQTLAHMIDKIIAETNTSSDLALTWHWMQKKPSECSWLLTIPTSSWYQSQITSHSIRYSTCTINKTIITDSSKKPKCHTQYICCIHFLWEFWENLASPTPQCTNKLRSKVHYRRSDPVQA